MSNQEHPMHFQTILYESDMEKLKQKSGHESTKDALGTAVEHYLKCRYTKKQTKDEVKL